MGVLCWLAITCSLYIATIGRNYKDAYSIRERAVWVVVALLFVLIVHELTHALIATIFAPGKVKIETGKDPIGLWSLRTVFPGDLGKGKRLAICQAPFVALTVIPTIALLAGTGSIFLFFVAMINCIGSYFDLVDILVMVSEGKKY